MYTDINIHINLYVGGEHVNNEHVYASYMHTPCFKYDTEHVCTLHGAYLYVLLYGFPRGCWVDSRNVDGVKTGK